MNAYLKSSLLVVGALVVNGCGNQSGSKLGVSNDQKTKPADTATDHSHERGKMLLTDAGKYHALLTAHLSPKGNELDIFFETTDSKKPMPVALPLKSFTAYASKPGDDQPLELSFDCAPAEERPKDEKPGTCSHFVAKAEWMKPTDILTVVFHLELDGERSRVTWENFNPKKYAHHEE